MNDIGDFDSVEHYNQWKQSLTKQEKEMDDFEMNDDFADFVDELTSSDKNDNACSIDNPDCEGCGS